MHTSVVNNENNNIAAICSGNGQIRWINLAQYYQTGEMNFVDAPSDNKFTNSIQTDITNKNQADSICSVCSLFTQLEHLSIGLLTAPIFIENPLKQTRFSFIQHFTKRSCFAPSSRDPPFLIR